MKIGRNEPCKCGSGKKFKKCCLPGIKRVEVPVTTKPEVIDYHMVQIDGKWHKRPGTVAITLGGKRSDDVDDRIESTLRSFKHEQSEWANAALHDIEHKLYACRFHLQSLESEFDRVLKRYSGEHKPGAGAAWEFEAPAIVYHLEAFLFQVKSTLDVITRFIAIFVPRLRSLRSYNSSGETRNGTFVAGGKVLRELRESDASELHSLFTKANEEWIQDLVLMRDVVTHTSRIRGLTRLVEEPYRGGRSSTVQTPLMPNGEKVDAYADRIFDALIDLVQACVNTPPILKEAEQT